MHMHAEDWGGVKTILTHTHTRTHAYTHTNTHIQSAYKLLLVQL